MPARKNSLWVIAVRTWSLNGVSLRKGRVCGTKHQFAALAQMAALLEYVRMMLSMKSLIVMVALYFGYAGNLSAQNLRYSFSACLPPTSNGDVNSENCPLTDGLPSPIVQGIGVTECHLLSQKEEALGQVFLVAQCSISNRSKERVTSLEYQLSYFEKGISIAQKYHFNTILMVPVLQPHETRSLKFVVPRLLIDVHQTELYVAMRVLSVRLANGQVFR